MKCVQHETVLKMANAQPSLTANVTSYLEGHVYPEKKNIKLCHQRLIDRALAPLLRLVGEKDDRFQSEVPRTSDCTFGVTATGGHRFDVLVPLRNLLTRKRQDVSGDEKCFTYTDSCQSDNPYVAPLPGFGFLRTDPAVTFLQDLCGREEDEQGSLLMPGKVLRRFCRLLEEAVNALEQECFWEREPTVYQVTVELQGPAVALTLLMRGNSYTVSLLPAVNVNAWPEGTLSQWPHCSWMSLDRIESVKPHFYLFAIRPKGTEDARKLWCSCLYPGENLLAAQADEGRGYPTCRRRALDAILAMQEENHEDFNPVGPRIIRTVFLHQCVQYPQDEDWEPDKLGRAFVDLFLAVIQALLKGACPHFFLPETNLLAGYDRRDLKPVADHLKAILNDVVQRPDKTFFLGDVKGRKEYTRLKTTCGPKF
ncbi:protein mab-21-like 2 [Patiria miniata]|uniref:Mab-21-like HhH/H2TH-like domain-containing protein n=1 Tax=Patiria miniata TaxID=46514 RepID=A0A914A276_PATMI|nr:protein mab-21-like 2 [Patiria miniata]